MSLPDTCPFCSHPKAKTDEDGDYHYRCGSWASMQQGSFRSHRCKDDELARLAARVAELEARCKRMEELGAELRVCAGYLGWTSSDDSDCITRAERACIAWDKEAKP